MFSFSSCSAKSISRKKQKLKSDFKNDIETYNNIVTVIKRVQESIDFISGRNMKKITLPVGIYKIYSIGKAINVHDTAYVANLRDKQKLLISELKTLKTHIRKTELKIEKMPCTCHECSDNVQ